MPASKDFQLYFIALIPPEPFFSEVLGLKNEVKDRFNSKAALNSPPHVTLHMPFRFKESKEEMINSTLSAYCQKRQSFQVIQNGLGAFEPRVIFVNVEESEALADLQRELLKTMRMELKLDSTNYKNQGFHPHMTIAFRDLKKSIFPEAWNHFKNKSINKTWPAEVIHLLKHKGQHWEVFKSFALQKEVRTLSLPN